MTINTIDTTTPLVGLKAGAEVYNANFTDTNNAASKEVGTLPAQVPTNADLPEFGTAATKDTGTAAGDIPLNSTTEKDYQIGSASFASNTYTFTPKSGVFRALSSGSIIEFDLPASSITGQAKANYNGAVSNLNWINNSATVSGDIDSAYTKRIRCKYDGTNWLIISDVSGGNTNGLWDRKADGAQTCCGDLAEGAATGWTNATTHSFINAGAGTWPKAFSSTPKASYSAQDSQITARSAYITLVSSTASGYGSCYYVTPVASTSFSSGITGEFIVEGRWY